MEQTLELSDSPRSAARQFMAFLVELSTQKDDIDSNAMSTKEIHETSSALCQDEPSIEAPREKPADNIHN